MDTAPSSMWYAVLALIFIIGTLAAATIAFGSAALVALLGAWFGRRMVRR